MERETSSVGREGNPEPLSWQENLKVARLNSGTFAEDVTEVTFLQASSDQLEEIGPWSKERSSVDDSVEVEIQRLDLSQIEQPPDLWGVAKTKTMQCVMPPPRGNSAQALIDRLNSINNIPSDSAHVVATNSAIVEEMARFRRTIVEKQSIRRGPPEWIWIALFAGLVVGGLGYVYLAVSSTSKVKTDTTFEAKIRRLERARAALDEGHRLALLGPRRADDAVEAYTSALALEPTLAPAERGLGVAYTALGEPDKAVKHFKKYLELSPSAKDRKEVLKLIDFYQHQLSGTTRRR